MALNRARRKTYKAARVMGDANAISRGPGAVGRRVVRRQAYRGVFGWLSRPTAAPLTPRPRRCEITARSLQPQRAPRA